MQLLERARSLEVWHFIGVRPIGMVTLFAAKAAGYAEIYVTDIDDSKL